MIRAFLVVLAALLFLSIGSVLLLYVDRIQDETRRQLVSLHIVQRVFKLFLALAGTTVAVEGAENIPADEAVLFVGNHRSFFDVIIGYTLVKGPTGFVAKKELEKTGTLKLWMERVNCLFMDRGDLKQSMKVILDAIQKVKSGISIWIYPEGTRSTGKNPEELLPFKEGSFKIAEKSGCKVVPVAMLGTEQIWEGHARWYLKKTTVRVRIGAPIDVRALPREEQKRLGVRVREEIIEMLRDMKDGSAGNQR